MLFFLHMLPWPFWHGVPRTHEKQRWGGVSVCRQECLQDTVQFQTALPFPRASQTPLSWLRKILSYQCFNCALGHGACFLNYTVIIPCWICQLSCFLSAAERKIGSGLGCSKWESHHVLQAYKNAHTRMGLTLYICYVHWASKHALFTNEHSDCHPSHQASLEHLDGWTLENWGRVYHWGYDYHAQLFIRYFHFIFEELE